MYLKALKIGLSKGSVDLKIGEEFETDDASGASLVADGYAEEDTDRVEAPNIDENGKGDQTPGGNGEGGQMTPGQSAGSEDGAAEAEAKAAAEAGAADPEAELAKVRKALDDQYGKDELYKAAKTAGVDIAYNAKKSDIVEAIIVQGKAAALLK